MNKALTFVQITIAVIIGSLSTDIIKGSSLQCVSRDSKGKCTETRLECIWNSRTIPSVIPACFFEKQV